MITTTIFGKCVTRFTGSKKEVEIKRYFWEHYRSDPETKENERAYNEVRAWFLGNKKWQRNFKQC
jgi:hypothetical protein